jgi:outer membrane receptor protein involved in Fe transport
MEEVLVTGSRVRRKDLDTPAPVTVISSQTIVDSGKVTIGDFLQTLPANFGSLNAQSNNGGDGSTQVNLRGLGPNRTLVLVNGRRLPGSYIAGGIAGGVSAEIVDLNSIPTFAVDHIEILKDGASAVYGSDAIAGVVNIITKKDFKGAEANAYAGTSQNGDGTTFDVNGAAGISNDQGSAMFGLGYFNQQPVMAGDRSWANKIWSYDYSAGSRFFSGSSGTPAGTFTLDPSTCSTPACKALLQAYGPGLGFFFVNPSSPAGYSPVTQADRYNFEPTNYLYTPAQRISLYSEGHYNLGESSRAYYEASFVNRQTSQQLASEPLFTLTAGNGAVVSANSIYNPFGVDLSDVRRRLTEFGPRYYTENINTVRFVTGLDGTTPERWGALGRWFWDTSINFGYVTGATTTSGTLIVPNIQNAIGPSMVVGGTPVCVSKAGDPSTIIPGCVPLNLLGGPGTITPAMKQGLTYTGINANVWQLVQYSANVSRELFKLLSERPVGLAAGYEFRRESGYNKPNPIQQEGWDSDSNAQATGGAFNTNEAYLELVVPVVNDMPGIEDLEVDLATRFVDYSTFGTDWTYKIGGRYRPVRDVTLRGTYSTAFRAPSIFELYQGNSDNFESASDPCAGPGIAPNSTLGQQCGKAANNLSNMTQIKSINGGNPNLKPEKATTWTAGVVFEPRWVKNLSVTVDYYDIDVTTTIGTVGTATILAQCYTGNPAVTPQYCSLVTRDPTTGQITLVSDTFVNLKATETAGLDIGLNYKIQVDPFGVFGLSFAGTWLNFYNQTNPDGTVIHGKGTYDITVANQSLGIFPAFKSNTTAMWGLNGWGANLTWHFVSSFKECGTPTSAGTDSASTGGLCFIDSSNARTVGMWNSFDLSASYKLKSSFGTTTFAAGVNNLFYAIPPTIYSNGTYVSDPSAYDFMGRYFWIRLGQSI